MIALDKLFEEEGEENCPRDVVRFVPYKKYKGKPETLAKQLLDSVPNQISKYFELTGKNFQIYDAQGF